MNLIKQIKQRVELKTVLNFVSCQYYSNSNVAVTEKGAKISHSKRLNAFFNNDEELLKLKPFIPQKYLKVRRKETTESIYLICPKIAKRIVDQLLPILKENEEQLICETNAGLGLISSELLDNGIKQMRLYETCPDYRIGLKSFDEIYPGRVEIFTRDFFDLHRYAFMDRQDNSNRVELLLANVPKKQWSDDEVMTIIGTMSDLFFLRYLLHMVCLRMGIASYGRIQLFAIMRPRDYAILSSDRSQNLNAYQNFSILFQLFFDYQLMDKIPRELFLPWPGPNKTRTQYPNSLDQQFMYLVKINLKRELPVPINQLLGLLYFVRHFYGRGNSRIIPTIEKWVPGCGINIILPRLQHEHYFENIDIFTFFRDLTPQEIKSVYEEIVEDPMFKGSPFMTLMENHLIKSETIESDLYKTFEKKNS